MVIDWYNQTVGTPYEGAPMPWLYHKYTGHDNNRDWFMLTQVETQIVTKILYEEWFPEVIYDVHQMGNSGARFVVPPYFDPVNPNIPPILQREISLIGGTTRVRSDLTRIHRCPFQRCVRYMVAWRVPHCPVSPQHGRYPHRSGKREHRFAGVPTPLKFAWASPRFGEHTPNRPTFPNRGPAVGGGLGTLSTMKEAAVYSILSSVATRKEMFLSNFYKMGLSAIEKGKTEPPRAFLVPTAQRDLNTALKMLEILQRGGVEIHRATANFTADGVEYPEGTYVILMAQPFRAPRPRSS